MACSYVDKEFFQNLSDSELVWHFSSDPNTAMFAFDMLGRHQAAAALQMQRIVEARNYASSKMPEEPNISDQLSVKRYFETARGLYQPIFIEIHFYFVSWVNCQNMIKVLGSFPEFIEAKKYFHSAKNILTNMLRPEILSSIIMIDYLLARKHQKSKKPEKTQKQDLAEIMVV